MKNILALTAVLIIFTSTPGLTAMGECDSVNLKVNGLVCDFCAGSLEKMFDKKDEVKDIKVDLDKGNILVNFKPGKSLSDDELKSVITASGYDVTGVERECR